MTSCYCWILLSSLELSYVLWYQFSSCNDIFSSFCCDWVIFEVLVEQVWRCCPHRSCQCSRWDKEPSVYCKPYLTRSFTFSLLFLSSFFLFIFFSPETFTSTLMHKTRKGPILLSLEVTENAAGSAGTRCNLTPQQSTGARALAWMGGGDCEPQPACLLPT